MKKFLLAALLITAATSANAAQLDTTSGDWSVYSEGKSCYISSIPVAENGNFKKRGQPYILINSKSKTADELNVSSGYEYKPDVHVELSLDGKKYRLFSQGENAWAKNAADDKTIITAMKTGTKVEIKGLSSKNSYSTDTYSLKGLGVAYKRMKQLCK